MGIGVLMGDLFGFVFQSQTNLGRWINLIILGLFFSCVLIILKNAARLSKEKKALALAEENLEGLDAGKANNIQKKKEALQLGVPEKSIVFKHIDDLFRVRYIGRINQDTLRDLLHNKEALQSGFIRYVAGILTMLGLTGTILGLSLSIFEISPIISGLSGFDGLREVTSSMGRILGGMKTAFSTTICGIIATLLLTFINYIYSRVHAIFMLALEELSIFQLIPILLVPEENEAALRLAESMKEGAEDLEQGAKALIKAKKALGTLSHNMVTATEKVDKGLSGLFEATKSFKEGTDSISRYEKQIVEMGTEFTTLVGEMKASQEKFGELLKPVVQEVIKTAITESMTLVGEMSEKAKATFVEEVNEAKTIIQSLRESITSERLLFKTEIETIADKNKAFVSEFKTGVEAIITLQNKELQAFFNDQKVTRQGYQELSDLQTCVVDDNKESMQALIDQQTRLLSTVETLLNNRLPVGADSRL